MAVRNNSGIVRTGLILALDAADQLSYTLNEVEVLVVAGGGGGATGGGGGGAGGLVYNTSYKVTQGSAISVTVGNGGGNTSSWGGSGGRGQDSVFGNITANGGGPGSHRGNIAGTFGSGGGDAGAGETILVGTIGQGKNGGLSRNITSTQEEPGGGGGGAGENGESTASTSGTFGDSTAPRNGIAGKGGNGLYFPQFAPFAGSPAGWFAGGGGGCNRSGYGRPGGLGGGGRGGKSPTAGATNSGGGGGGTGYSGYGGGGTSAVGGSGIVIVRYPGPQKATGGNSIVQSSGHTIHIFTASGTFTPLSSSSIKSTFYGLQDLSGTNTISAVAVNGPTLDSSLVSGAVSFDGTNDLLDLGTNRELNLFTGDFAISSWFYRENTGAEYGNLIGNYYTNSTATTTEWQIMIRRTTSPIQTTVYRVGSGSIISNQSLGSGVEVNTWVNLVLTRVGNVISLYVNSNLITTVTESTVTQWGTGTTSNMCIGVDGNKVQEPFGGKIANMFIYRDKGLSALEVQQNFNAQRRRFGV